MRPGKRCGCFCEAEGATAGINRYRRIALSGNKYEKRQKQDDRRTEKLYVQRNVFKPVTRVKYGMLFHHFSPE